MYVCKYIYMYVCMYVFMYVCMYVYHKYFAESSLTEAKRTYYPHATERTFQRKHIFKQNLLQKQGS